MRSFSLQLRWIQMLPAAKKQAIAQSIDDRKQRNATLAASGDPLAKFQARSPADDERRRVREAVRKHRASKRAAKGTQRKRPNTLRSALKPKTRHSSAKALRRKRPNIPRSVAKPTQWKRQKKPMSRHIPLNCCGRRKQRCICFTKGRGLEISRSFKHKKFDSLPPQVLKSRIQTWRDTGDMPGYMRQIGWRASMRYSWLFPIAFVWRHFDNEEFWDALQTIGAVLQNQPPNFALMEQVMRAFQARNVPYHGGIFFSASALTKYRYGSAAKPAKWQECEATQDFITKEILALKVMWHVAISFKQVYDSLQRNPTRQCWRAATEKFLAALQEHTKGIFAAYSLKIALDAVLLSQPCLETVVSYWPMECTAYMNELPKLYPNCRKKQDDLFLAGCHFHQRLKASFPKSFLRDSLAQTCWLARGVTK